MPLELGDLLVPVGLQHLQRRMWIPRATKAHTTIKTIPIQFFSKLLLAEPTSSLEKKEPEVSIAWAVGVTTGSGVGVGSGVSTEQAGSWVKNPMLSIAPADSLP